MHSRYSVGMSDNSTYSDADAGSEDGQDNSLTHENFDGFREAIEIFYIRDNISGRLQFLKEWPVAGRYILGETLIGYDHDGAKDREHRRALEDEAEGRRFALSEVLETLEEKSVEKSSLQLEYIEGVVKFYGSELAGLFYAPKIIARFPDCPMPEIVDVEAAEKVVAEEKVFKKKDSKSEVRQKSEFIQETPKKDPVLEQKPAAPAAPKPAAKESAAEESPAVNVRPESLVMPSIKSFRKAVPKDPSARKAVPKKRRTVVAPEAPRSKPVEMVEIPMPDVDVNPQVEPELVRGLLPVHKPGQRPTLKGSDIRDLAKKLAERKKNPPKEVKRAPPPVVGGAVGNKGSSIVKPAAQKKPEPELVFVPATKKGPLPGKPAKPKKT